MRLLRRRGRVLGLALAAGLVLPLGATVASGLVASSPASASITPSAANGSTYHPVSPYRVLDTRANSGQFGQGNTLTAGRTINVPIVGTGVSPNSVPYGATAVVVNVTAVNPSANGYLTVFAAGQTVPFASTVNFVAGQTVANQATVTLGNPGQGGYGQITVYNYTGSTDVVVDVQGYYAPYGQQYQDVQNEYVPGGYEHGAGYVPLSSPTRVLDTRAGSGQQGAGETLGPDSTLNFFPGTNAFPGHSTAIVPSDATAVVLNVTAVNPTADGFFTVWTTGASQPLASNLNFTAGSQPVPNKVIVPINQANKEVSIYNSAGDTDAVVDLEGYFSNSYETSQPYYPLVAPARIADTRAVFGLPYGGQTLGAGSILTINVPPDNSQFQPDTGIFAPDPFCGEDINVTVTDTTAQSYLTVYPANAGAMNPLASDLNWLPGMTVANGSMVSSLSTPSVAINVFNYQGSADVVVDVYGYFGPAKTHSGTQPCFAA